ncbi:MAG TPA: heme-binding protein [Thermoanaerobaculia bacterium]|nr:heme-binding protein [Thermoanaerobaculia bacterium]
MRVLILLVALPLSALPPDERPGRDREPPSAPAPPAPSPVPAPAPDPLDPPLGPSPAPAVACPPGAAPLTAAEVQALLFAAAQALDSDYAVAVVDRGGEVLGVYDKNPAATVHNERAVGLARTAAFFSHDQAPLSSRTVRFLSGVHFPAGVARTANAALYGIENTNRGCPLNVSFLGGQSVTPAMALAGGPGTGPVTGKPDPSDSHLPGPPAHKPGAVAVDPGGIPVFRGGFLVGGLGVAGPPAAEAEFAAISGVAGGGFGIVPVNPLPPPGAVFIDGIRLPFVQQVKRPAGTVADPALGGSFAVAPVASPGCVPEGYLVGPLGSAQLSAAEVDRIVQQSIAAANRIRGVIRLPLGSRARMVIAVGDANGNVLALYRMADATVFSIDVAVAKARNVAFYSANGLPGVPPGTAVTNRTIGFGAQPLFPPGIDGTSPGPFYNLFLQDLANPCTQGGTAPNVNGVVFFAGSVPLYRAGTNPPLLIGGLGISGDGVEQDDYVSFFGAQGFLPPESIRADQIKIGGVRLPFLKFPRNPER